ncbi:hypothetical protein HBDW_08310 [Herbaspirillum sp. DW155]|uniref:hypothetical protein n=1 Tax=Herbaspirillum sp. DW155 TaxID=3095609 RepID=UPI0030900DBA|nr:hypothetical protein HBDW_08310 [Herbaspirillum sp. DW155]
MLLQAQRRIFHRETRRRTLRFIAQKEIISGKLNLKPRLPIWFFSSPLVLHRVLQRFPNVQSIRPVQVMRAVHESGQSSLS